MQSKDNSELREIFGLADTECSGYIDEAELLTLGRAVNPHFTGEKCHVLLKEMDTSHDGKVSSREFVTLVGGFMEDLPSEQKEQGMRAMRAVAEDLVAKAKGKRQPTYDKAGAEAGAKKKEMKASSELRKIFELADTNHSGYIDAAELLALGRAVNRHFTSEKCRVLLKEMDTSHDGKVSPTEFVTMVGTFMDGLAPEPKDQGMRAMRSAAEGLAAQAGEKRKQALEKTGAEARAKHKEEQVAV